MCVPIHPPYGAYPYQDGEDTHERLIFNTLVCILCAAKVFIVGLVVCDRVGAIAPPALDPPRRAQTCNSMFFEDGSGVFEQTVRLVVSIVSYLVPNWATIYVFYVLPRFQFSTALDVPDFNNLAAPDRDESAYELLLNEQEKDHI
ncbi:hypothetical protein FI667_g14160, partial [Globisporangium splendens]